MKEYYPATSESKSNKSFLERISLNEPGEKLTPNTTSIKENETDFDIKNIDLKNLDSNNTIIIIGAVIFILSIIEILAINSGIGIIALFIGVIILCYGIYKTKDVKETEAKGSNPATGDQILLYISLATISLIGITAINMIKKH